MQRKDVVMRARHHAGPIERLDPVVPSDATDLPLGLTMGLFVGTPGTLTVVDQFGTSVQLVSGGGQYHPIRVARVHATGTSAGGIVALY